MLMDQKIANNKKQVKKRSQLEAMAFVSGIGIHFVVIIGICIFLGKSADGLWNTGPYGTIFGIVIGFPIGFYSVYKKIMGNF